MSIMPVRLCLASRKNPIFSWCAAVLSELFFIQTKQRMSGNTLCIAGHFCEVWAEKSRSKPFSSYPDPPKASIFHYAKYFMYSIIIEMSTAKTVTGIMYLQYLPQPIL